MTEYHPNDSRIKIDSSGTCQSLTGRMGTGGGNVPLVVIFIKSRRAQSKDDYETWKEADVANTLNLFDTGGDTRATTLIVKNDEDIYGKEVR